MASSNDEPLGVGGWVPDKDAADIDVADVDVVCSPPVDETLVTTLVQALDKRMAMRNEELLRQFSSMLSAHQVMDLGPDACKEVLPKANGNGSSAKRKKSESSKAASKVPAELLANELEEEEARHKQKAQERSVTMSAIRKLHQATNTSEITKPKTLAQKIASSWQFESLFAVVLFSNSLLIGVQVEFSATDSDTYFPSAIISAVYTVLFLIEVIVRIGAEGCRKFFLKSKNLWWNYLDFFVVVANLIEFVSELVLGLAEAGETGTNLSTNLRVFRIIRMARLVRAFRIVKVIRFIRALRSLVHSIMTAMKAITWSLMLLLLVIYVFGILFTDAVAVYIQEEDLEGVDVALLRHRFGSLHATMHTLLRSILQGLDWDVVVQPLIGISWFYGYIFTCYIAFAILALLNSITGVLCQCAIDSAQRDHEQLIQAMQSDEKIHTRTLTTLFHNLSEDGTITLLDFESKFAEPALRAFFSQLDLDPVDAWSLFKLLDKDGSGDVDVSDFLDGCLRLRGPAKAIDIASLVNQSKVLQKHTLAVERKTDSVVTHLSQLQRSVHIMRHDLSKVNETGQIQEAVNNVISDVFFGNSV